MLGFAHTAPIRTGSLPPSTGLIVLYGVFVAFWAIVLLVVLVVRWPAGPDDSQETDQGSGEGPRPVGPDPGPGPRGDQALWADFERQFAHYVARPKPEDRPRVGRSQSRGSAPRLRCLRTSHSWHEGHSSNLAVQSQRPQGTTR